MNHQLEHRPDDQRAFACRVCGSTWVRHPRSLSRCPGVRIYGWQQAPEYLQTYTQLRTKHLKPRDRRTPDGCLSTPKAWIWLYDEREALPRRLCSERQREALRQAWQKTQEKYTCQRCGTKPASLADLCHYFGPASCKDCFELLQWEAEQQAHEDRLRSDCDEAIRWARAMLSRTDWALIDIETTDLDGVAVEICALAPDGTVLFQSLVNPQCPVTPGARAVHGITDEELASAPTLADVWPGLLSSLNGRTVLLAYNADFDCAVLARSAKRAGLPELTQEWQCVMHEYARYFGAWSNYWHDYTWQPLPGASHRAQGDALAALAVLQRMAATKMEEENEAEQTQE